MVCDTHLLIDRGAVLRVFLINFPRRAMSSNLLENEEKSERDVDMKTVVIDMDLDYSNS